VELVKLASEARQNEMKQEHSWWPSTESLTIIRKTCWRCRT
jgi:hypothetical protein